METGLKNSNGLCNIRSLLNSNVFLYNCKINEYFQTPFASHDQSSKGLFKTIKDEEI